MHRTDALGQSYTLTGFQAFVSVNNVLDVCGSATVSDAPALATPTALVTATATTTGGTLSIAYTPTPMPTNTKLIVRASSQRSAGRAYEADYRVLAVTAAAAVSPYNALAAYTAKFGVPVVGNRIFFSLTAMLGGFESGSLVTSIVVTA